MRAQGELANPTEKGPGRRTPEPDSPEANMSPVLTVS